MKSFRTSSVAQVIEGVDHTSRADGEYCRRTRDGGDKNKVFSVEGTVSVAV